MKDLMKLTKRIIPGIFSLLIMLVPSFVNAQDTNISEGVISSPSLVRNGSLMTAGVKFDFSPLKLKTNQVAVFTPMIVNGGDTLELPSVGVFGRTRWYQFQRSGARPLESEEQISMRYSKDMEPVDYVQNVDYIDWMNGSYMVIRRDDYGCAGCNEGEMISSELISYAEAPKPEELLPDLIFKEAVAETMKMRELSGRAFVDFPVNKIVIYPDYRNNHYELGKIIATIDSVKNDPDITVNSIFIAGTASPEGPYDNNVYLAKNRTIALKEYVTNLYNFPKDFIQTDYDPVDWKGLREWLENNNIAHKEEILAIVNSDIEDFARNSKIKKDFPVEYDWLWRNIYPALRHSDYRIEYTIRQFSDVAEIAEIIKVAPQKLSLNEMYLLAGTLEPGSDEYNEVFEIAVRMYPSDETANLNAANSAMMQKNLNQAEKYLAKAGESPEAVYARGVLAGLKGDYADGIRLIEIARRQGIKGGESMLETMKNNIRINK